MVDKNNFSHLIQEAYRVRTCAYYAALIILFSKMFETGYSSAILCLVFFLVFYPHLVHFTCGHFRNSANGARLALLFDGLIVGLLVVAVEFSMLASVAFLGGLVMSTLVIAKPIYLLGNMVSLGCLLLLNILLTDPDITLDGWPATNVLSAIFIVCYGGLIASLSFVETTELDYKRRATDQDRYMLQGTYDRLRPYVSPQLVRSLQVSAEIVTTRKPVTIFFSDIEGFTGLMDRFPEVLMTRLLNEYLDAMTDIAIEFGGTVDKFIGDGVMILFGAPVSESPMADARRCVRMAIEMQTRREQLSRDWCSDGVESGLHIRMGIHSGYGAVGNFGSRQRMDYTAIGGVVNLASRLESAARRDQILISGDTWKLVQAVIDGIPMAPIRVKGIGREISVISVSGARRKEDRSGGIGFRLLSTG